MINAETSLSSLVVPLKKLQSDAQNTCVALALNRKTYTNSDTDQTSFSTPMEYFQWVSDISMKSHLTCLLRCSNYSDVIAAVDAYNSSTSTPPSSPPHSFDNYKSYALYRSKKFKEAIEVSEKALEGMGSSEFRYSEMASFHHRHIVAQSHYRLQNYTESLSSYDSLLSTLEFDDPEVLTNMLAGLISSESYDLPSLERYSSVSIVDEDFDLTFNLATAHAAMGDFRTAAEKFADADDACKRVVSKADYEEEVSSIRAQQAYVLLGLGDSADSSSAYNELSKLRSTKADTALNFAVLNNLAASSATVENARSHIACLEPAYKAAKDRLNSVQARQAEENLNILRLLSSSSPFPATDGPAEDVLQRTAVKVALDPSSSFDIVRGEISSVSSPDDAKNLKLMLAQLHINEGQIKEAIDVLDSFEKLKFQPALVKTRMDLYSQLKSPKAESLLDDTLASGSIDTASKSRLKISKGEYLLACGNFEAAGKIFKDTLDEDTGSMSEEDSLVLTSLLVQAYSHFDVDSAEQYTNELPFPTDHNSDVLDAEDLEFTELPRATRTSCAASQLLSVNTDVERDERRMKNRAETKKKREERRKLHIEKLSSLGKYNPNVKPDPERWLPKSQRSYNKKGKKNRDKFSGVQGAGGGGLKDAAKLDAAARAAGGNSESRAFSTAHLQIGGKKSRRR